MSGLCKFILTVDENVLDTVVLSWAHNKGSIYKTSDLGLTYSYYLEAT